MSAVHPYVPGDVALLQGVLDLSMGEMEESRHVLDSISEENLQRYSRTLWLEEQHAIACFGVFPLHTGVGRAWSILTQDAVDHPKALYASVLRELRGFEAREGLNRIETVVKLDHPKAHTWIRHLGFERETKDAGMRGYGPDGSAYHLYARVKES